MSLVAEVSVVVRCASPAIVGAIVLTGAEACTVQLAALVALTVPSAFVAVTLRRTVCPSSATASV